MGGPACLDESPKRLQLATIGATARIGVSNNDNFVDASRISIEVNPSRGGAWPEVHLYRQELVLTLWYTTLVIDFGSVAQRWVAAC